MGTFTVRVDVPRFVRKGEESPPMSEVFKGMTALREAVPSVEFSVDPAGLGGMVLDYANTQGYVCHLERD